MCFPLACKIMVPVVFYMMFGLPFYVESYLNLYIDKEDLKNDLFLDFGNDIYILSNGKPAPLLSNPEAFKNLIAPLPPSIDKIKFHWYAYPRGHFSSTTEKEIKYTLELSSSDNEVMEKPKVSIASSAVIHLPIRTTQFNINFPCSGKKNGLVDLGFQFNYSINASDISHDVTIIVRRHCYKIEKMRNISAFMSMRNSTSIRSAVIRKSTMFSNNTILGIILGISALVLSVLIIFALHYLQKRNKRLHMKFDVDYELKKKEREQEDLLNNFSFERDLNNDEKQLLQSKTEPHAKPIYISGNKRHKWKRIRRKHHFTCKSLSPYFSNSVLENILEEEDEAQMIGLFSTEQTNPIILNLSSTIDKSKHSVPINSVDTENNIIKDNNHAQTIESTVNITVNINKKTDDVHEKMFKQLNEEWSLQFSKYILFPSQIAMIDERFIRKDTFSLVHCGKVKGLDKIQPSKLTPIAVKIMIPSTDINVIRTFMFEAQVMKKLSHENITDLVGIVLTPSRVPMIITPYMRHSDLNQLLRNSRSTPRHHQTLSSRQLINFAVQISNGMKYLVSKGYIHRALCTQNVMVNSAFTIKISGLCFAKEGKKQSAASIEKDIEKFVKWMAVESILENVFTEKSDVWSFGVVLWELMTFGKQPYIGLSNAEMKNFLLDCHRLQSPPNCPDMIVQIMFDCWHQLPKDRPYFTELFERLSGYEDNYKKYVAEYVAPQTKII